MSRRFEWTQTISPPAENESWWTRENGQKIRVVDMSDYHLRNAIFLINRRLTEVKKTPTATQLRDTLKTTEGVLRREAQRRALGWV